MKTSVKATPWRAFYAMEDLTVAGKRRQPLHHSVLLARRSFGKSVAWQRAVCVRLPFARSLLYAADGALRHVDSLTELSGITRRRLRTGVAVGAIDSAYAPPGTNSAAAYALPVPSANASHH